MTGEFDEEVVVVEVVDAQGNQVKEGVAYLFDSGGAASVLSVLIVERINGSGTVDGWDLDGARAFNDIPTNQLFRPLQDTWAAWPEWKQAITDYAGIAALDLS